MLSNRLLTIQECQFSLPNDFNGTLGDALMLLAKCRLKSEENNKINLKDVNISCYDSLCMDNNISCSIKYALSKLSEDGSKWENL